MCTQLTNSTINVRARIENGKIVVLFHLPFFICFSSNRMKIVIKKRKIVQYLYVSDL